MIILGVSALYHDSAACLVKNGEIVAAAQEERFSRVKHDASIPKRAIEYCINEGKLKKGDLDCVVYYDNPFLTLDRSMHNVLADESDSESVLLKDYESLFSNKLWIKSLIMNNLPDDFRCSDIPFYVTQHHISHAASAFYPSPFNKALIITIDGVGEWTTMSIGKGEGNGIELYDVIKYPHSLGLLYSAFTYFCGFKVNSGDYKFMGLAPYGKPVYYDLIKDRIIDVKPDGSFRLNLDYFDYHNGRTMINEEKMSELFGGGRREPETRITKREMDIASSVQKITEEVILKIANHAKEKYGENVRNLCLAGGVALNCVANGKLVKDHVFERIWIQPAAGDAGGALGAAMYAYYSLTGADRNADGIHDSQKGSYLGPSYSDEQIKDFFEDNDIQYHTPENVARLIANELSNQRIVGYFSGRMEYGPRALGHRSILADPRSAEMQSKLNLKIKYRESFRPFAPSVLKEDANDYFALGEESPYMLICADVKKDRCEDFDLDSVLEMHNMDMLEAVNYKRSDIPAVTHVDYSARVQTVDGTFNEDYRAIIKEFKKLTGCSVVVNTSFNVRGEPIVCSPEDAYKCFMRTEMDILVLNRFVLFKNEMKSIENDEDWRTIYELD